MRNIKSTYASKNILITGATGFIGRHLAAALVEAGANVTGTARDQARATQLMHLQKSGTSTRLATVVLDIADAGQVEELFAGRSFDTVFHLAALPAGDRSLERCAEQFAVTLGGTVNVATAILKSAAPALLVHVGSSEEYGGGQTPFKEEQALAPVSPYSAAKAAASQFLLAAHSAFALPVIITRPSVVYGPGQESGMVIPYLFNHYLRGKVPALSPGEQTRDFVYIDDSIKALMALGLRRDLSGETFNIGSGSQSKLKDVAEKIAHLCNYSGATGVGTSDYRKAEVMVHEECCASIKAKAGWQAETALNVGLDRTCRWWQKETSATIDEPLNG